MSRRLPAFSAFPFIIAATLIQIMDTGCRPRLNAHEITNPETRRLVAELRAVELAARVAAVRALVVRGESVREAFPAPVRF